MNNPDDVQEKKRKHSGQVWSAAASLATVIRWRCPDCEERTAALEHVRQALALAQKAIEGGEQ